MAKSSIEWTEHVWNPIRGCSRISEGCRNCYAERMAARFCRDTDYSPELGVSDPFRKADPFHGFAQMTPSGPRWTGRVELIPEMLDVPLRRRKPTTYFVNSMSDLFHEGLADEEVYRVFAVMEQCRQHTFIGLTKRAQRMAKTVAAIYGGANMGYVLPNVILGVSCEDQAAADERIPYLLQTPAACRMVSCEPLLGEIDLGCVPWPEGWQGPDDISDGIDPLRFDRSHLDWVIVGGESGPGARPMEAQWARSLKNQCVAASVPFFLKQWGEWLPAGQDGAPGGDTQVLNCSNEPMRVGKRAAGRLLDGRVWDERPALLHGGSAIPSLAISVDDTQFLAESRRLEDELCRVFGVPPERVCR